MRGLRFRIQHADGRPEEIMIEGERALIGSGAHCEIRLPVDQAATEHVFVSLTPTGPVVEARSFQPAATIGGASFTRAPVTEGAVLLIGGTKIWLDEAEIGEGQGVKQKKQEKTSPMTYVLAAVAVPISLFILLTDEPAGLADTMPQPPESLWPSEPAGCPQQAPEAALALARDRAVIADAKSERRPFHVQDGVAAVPLYQEAAACFRVAGKKKTAARYDKVAADLKQDVSDDFRTHRVRFEHAISVDDRQMVQKEVRVLLDFTEGLQGEYVTWLANLDRSLRVKYGREE